ncbi:TetR/AcrR family transcriptional regulator [Gallaecimonas pentaromativorans]|uniref:TetR family transcriptional regulator n=1 Tax=Gallaecimonas pentaromativorans TaxID=584787 RepID=A0A3N1P6L9_9GAMM|nr:TetR family transcriptional regulator [Gallaecimonas pentaromativorans]ROQ27644.1 TetR family transcriptional regulator [Gallaecimonas pentaromativorans]
MARSTLFNRQQALDDAMALFWQKGFYATSMKDLEKTLDMRPGSIYATFGSKEGLFQEALARYAELGAGELEKSLAAGGDPLHGLAEHVRRLGCLGDAGLPSCACMLVKSLLELGEGEAASRALAEHCLADIEARFAAAFAEAKALGPLTDDAEPALLASRLQVAIMGLRSYAQRRHDPKLLKTLAEDLAAQIEGMRVAAA